MRLLSTAFGHNEVIPAKYTCFGDNMSPPLQFFDVPETTKSLALIVDDPDAPNGDWVHWVVFNLPVGTEIAENTKPTGVEGTTSFGKAEYGAPCPPAGTHRYFFKLYALDALLPLDATADKQSVLSAMEGHILGQAELIGLVSK